MKNHEIEIEIAKYFFARGFDLELVKDVVESKGIYMYNDEIICSVDNDGIVNKEWK